MSKLEIICEKLSKSYSGKIIFKNLSFTISSFQSLLITGKNGSGKSTLIKIISNLIKESKGKILILEDNLEIERENWFLKIGLIAPYINLYDELTGFENIDFFYKLKSLVRLESKAKVNEILQEVNLYEKRNELVKNYSSGMKQRLKIAFATITEPEILLMDEPRTNLDKLGIDLIYKISEAQKKKGVLIIATNDEKDKELCDDTINIENYS